LNGRGDGGDDGADGGELAGLDEVVQARGGRAEEAGGEADGVEDKGLTHSAQLDTARKRAG
jgi:hypothetical protein